MSGVTYCGGCGLPLGREAITMDRPPRARGGVVRVATRWLEGHSHAQCEAALAALEARIPGAGDAARRRQEDMRWRDFTRAGR